ncbi:MAG: hypothetical protein R3F62_00530 [Planctomycetota bacterium]
MSCAQGHAWPAPGRCLQRCTRCGAASSCGEPPSWDAYADTRSMGFSLRTRCPRCGARADLRLSGEEVDGALAAAGPRPPCPSPEHQAWTARRAALLQAHLDATQPVPVPGWLTQRLVLRD